MNSVVLICSGVNKMQHTHTLTSGTGSSCTGLWTPNGTIRAVKCRRASRWRTQASYSRQNSGIFLYNTHSGTSLWMYVHAHYRSIAFLQFKLETSFSCTRTKFWHCNSSSKSNMYSWMPHLHLVVHSAYVCRFMNSVTLTGGLRQTLQMNIFSPQICCFWE